MTRGQEIVRQVNKSIYELSLKLDQEDGEFWCECEDMRCEERVLLTLREFEALQKRGGVLLSRAHASGVAATND
jgi:hypothetical protein